MASFFTTGRFLAIINSILGYVLAKIEQNNIFTWMSYQTGNRC